MADENPPDVVGWEGRDGDELDSVVIHPNPFGVIARAAGSATSLALAALIAATATILTMAVASDLGEAKIYGSKSLSNLVYIRWVDGTRLVVAVIALVLALLAGLRYARDEPAYRYTFTGEGSESTESLEGVQAPTWVAMLVGSAVVVSVLAILLNAVVFAIALRLHESPNFGLPGG